MKVYIVQQPDSWAAAVFDSLEAARKWAADTKGFEEEDVLGPYVVNDPDDDSPDWQRSTG